MSFLNSSWGSALFWSALFLCCVAVIGFLVTQFTLRIVRRKLKQELMNDAMVHNFFADFSRTISENSSADDWSAQTARYIANFVEAQSLCIFLVDPEKTSDGTPFLRGKGIAGAFPPQNPVASYVMTKKDHILKTVQRERILFGEGIIGKVASRMEAIYITDPLDPRLKKWRAADSSIETVMAVPLKTGGKCTGVICAVNNSKNPGQAFDVSQFSSLKLISDEVAMAQQICEAYVNRGTQQRLENELRFARNLQMALIPHNFPDWGKFRIYAETRPSKEVSGDFYDFIQIDDNRLLVVIGDACGKGTPACMIMAMTRSFIRAHISRFTTLKNLLSDLNENLYRDLEDGQYITLAICLLDKHEATLEYARAGHTDLLMYIRNHIRTITPEGAGLGLLPSELADFDTFCVEFTPDMEILLFTDGINEAESPFGEQFGVGKIKDSFMKSCLANEMPEDSVKRVLESVDEFTEKRNDRADDQTVVVIRHS